MLAVNSARCRVHRRRRPGPVNDFPDEKHLELAAQEGHKGNETADRANREQQDHGQHRSDHRELRRVADVGDHLRHADQPEAMMNVPCLDAVVPSLDRTSPATVYKHQTQNQTNDKDASDAQDQRSANPNYTPPPDCCGISRRAHMSSERQRTSPPP